MKFQYSPGLFGYGAKGSDGSAGMPGLGIYFTDYNPITNRILIVDAIENDTVLFSTAEPGTKLPSSREYLSGDLFIVPNGDIFEIDASFNTYDASAKGSLTKLEFFDDYNNIVAEGDYERKHNIFDGSTNYLIDNVMSVTKRLKYTISPQKIYNIEPKEFTRIEFTDIDISSYNVFTVYSSGEVFVVDDHKSIAIVKEANNNTFRIGNLDSSGNCRNVGLTFDVSALIHNRGGNTITLNSPSGTVLTKGDINIPSLYYPTGSRFNEDPASFTASPSSTSVDISWIRSDFTIDPSVTLILYFNPDTSAGSSYSIASTIGRQVMFHDLDAVGTLTVTELVSNTTYRYYIEIIKYGWIRTSVKKTVTTT